MKKLTVLQMLHAIEKAKNIYDIHYCRAGVGIVFYYPEKDPGGTRDVHIGAIKFQTRDDSWKQALSVDKYYPTFEAMVEAEYKKIQEGKMAKALKEGSVKKGGVNKAPTTQRPEKAPAAQSVEEPIDGLRFAVTRIHKMDGTGATKAFADIAINDELIVNALRIVEGKDGLFVSMPREEGKDGKWYNVVVPLKREIKDQIEKVVLEAYEA